MRIGIIADTHGNLDGWQRARELLGEVELIVHCGDVLYHGPKFEPVEGYGPMALAEAINDSHVPVLIARGNGDSDVDQLVLEVPLQSPYLFAQMEGLRILAAHGHITPPEELVGLARGWGIGLLLTGHVHVPVLARHGELVHVNPGTVTYPLAEDEALARRTCALWEDGIVTHYDLASGEVMDL
ncbi:MAG: phosphodiesterase [Armatimonadota bacterium]|nr:phosphodiesterase [Armatimonadota bacterium]